MMSSADSRSWLHDVFLPAIAHRVKTCSMVACEHEEFICKNRIAVVKMCKSLTAVDCHSILFFIGVGIGPTSEPLAAFTPLVLNGKGKPAQKLCFTAHSPSTAWDKFMFSFHKCSRWFAVDRAAIADLEMPSQAVEELKELVEGRDSQMALYAWKNAVVLKAGETLEEVLIERDLCH